MIRVLYFARLREALGSSGEELGAAQGLTVAVLMAQLASRGGTWQQEFTGGRIRAAVNQAVAPNDMAIKDGDEVAFFPPVTGG